MNRRVFELSRILEGELERVHESRLHVGGGIGTRLQLLNARWDNIPTFEDFSDMRGFSEKPGFPLKLSIPQSHNVVAGLGENANWHFV